MAQWPRRQGGHLAAKTSRSAAKTPQTRSRGPRRGNGDSLDTVLPFTALLFPKQLFGIEVVNLAFLPFSASNSRARISRSGLCDARAKPEGAARCYRARYFLT